MPTGGVLLGGTLVPFFTNLMGDLGEIGTACFIFKMKLLKDLIILHKTMYISLATAIFCKLLQCVQ